MTPAKTIFVLAALAALVWAVNYDLSPEDRLAARWEAAYNLCRNSPELMASLGLTACMRENF